MKKFLIDIGIALLLSAALFFIGLVSDGSYQPLVVDEEVVADSGRSSVAINVVGDVMLGRKVDRLIQSNGLDYPIDRMRDMLSDADITFCNLESPLSDGGTPLPGKGIWLRGGPENVQVLEAAGFDIVNLANNHAMDYLDQALLDTVAILDEAGIAHIGAGKDITAASEPYIEEVNGVKIAWLGYSEMADLFFSFSYPRPMRAEEDAPGISPYNIDDILEDIENIRDRADIIIVTLHWGLEYMDIPQDYQISEAHSMVDAGADIIIGHHPHCIQGAEVYHDGLIAYSLGNFIFDQDWSEKTSQGLMLKLTVNELGWQSAQFLPVYIRDCQPYLLEGEDGEEVLTKMTDISSSFGGVLEVEGEGLAVRGWETEE